MSWHVEPDVLTRYGRVELSGSAAASVEAHLDACERCREQLSATSARARLDLLWLAVADAVDAPTPGPVARLLVRFGLSEHTTRLLLATPSLRFSWFAGVLVTLATAVLAAGAGAGSGEGALFLVIVPVLPVAGVAASYGPSFDPMHEITKASPTGSFRVLLVRTTAVVLVSMALAGVAALAVGPDPVAGMAWLLPALALSAGSLALSTYLPAHWAATTLSVAWVGGLLVDARLETEPGARLASAIVSSGAFRPSGQLLFAALAIVFGLIVLARRETFEFGPGV